VVPCEFKFGNGMRFFKLLPGDGDKLVKFIDSASPSRLTRQGKEAVRTGYRPGADAF
jgi:hypothetical protein